MTSSLPPQRRSSKRSAVTMTDLVITLLIIGILAAAAAPHFVIAYDKLQAEATARRIAADLNYARRTAVQTSRPTTVTFRSSKDGYDMTGVPDPTNALQDYSVELPQLDENPGLTVSFDGSLKLSFNSYGRPLVGGSALVSGQVMVSCGGQSRTVVMNNSTGEATVP